MPDSSGYSLTKYAINGYFEALRIEIVKDNISINTISPGPVIATENSLNPVSNIELEPNKRVNDSKRVTMMKTDRCAQLFSTCIAHDIFESWLSAQPVLFFFYIKQYLPILNGPFAKFIGNLHEERSK